MALLAPGQASPLPTAGLWEVLMGSSQTEQSLECVSLADRGLWREQSWISTPDLYCLATAREETAAFPGTARKVKEVPT